MAQERGEAPITATVTEHSPCAKKRDKHLTCFTQGFSKTALPGINIFPPTHTQGRDSGRGVLWDVPPADPSKPGGAAVCSHRARAAGTAENRTARE